MAVESFSIPSVTDVLCENLSNYEEFRLHGTCTAVYHGNKVRREWLIRLHEHIYTYYHRPALPKRNSQRPQEEPQVEENAPPPLRLSMETIAVHNSRMGRDKRKWKRMPGETVEQKWDYYIHREPLNLSENDPIFSNNEATSSRDRGSPQGST